MSKIPKSDKDLGADVNTSSPEEPADTIAFGKQIILAPPVSVQVRRNEDHRLAIVADRDWLDVIANDRGQSVDGQARDYNPSGEDDGNNQNLVQVNGQGDRGLDADEIIRRASFPQVGDPRVPGRKSGKFPGYTGYGNSRRVPPNRSLTEQRQKGSA